jgi:hypothetical protein
MAPVARTLATIFFTIFSPGVQMLVRVRAARVIGVADLGERFALTRRAASG